MNPKPSPAVRSGHPRGQISPAVPVILLVALSLAVGFLHLNSKSLWADEAVTAGYVHLSLSGLWTQITGPDPNMSVYYLTLHFWAAIFGSSEVALRSLSVLAGACSVPLIVAVGNRLFGRPAGLLAGLLLAIDATLVDFQQDARSYAMLVALSLLSSLLFLRALERPSAGRLCAYSVAAVAAVYTQYFAAPVLLAQLLSLLCRPDQRENRRAWALSWLAICVCCAPELIAAHGHVANVAWIGRPSLRDLVGFPSFLTDADIRGGAIPSGLLSVAILYLVVTELRSRARWRIGFLAAWMIGPVLVNFVISSVSQSFWINRYMIIVLPPFLVLGAAGITRIPWRPVAVVGTVALGVALLVNLQRWYAAPPLDNYRAASAYVLDHRQVGDRGLYGLGPATVGTLAGVDPGIAYYARERHAAPPPPVELDRLTDPGASPPPRFWFVLEGTLAKTAADRVLVERRLAGRYRPAGGARAFSTGPTVQLFVRESGALR